MKNKMRGREKEAFAIDFAYVPHVEKRSTKLAHTSMIDFLSFSALPLMSSATSASTSRKVCTGVRISLRSR